MSFTLTTFDIEATDRRQHSEGVHAAAEVVTIEMEEETNGNLTEDEASNSDRMSVGENDDEGQKIVAQGSSEVHCFTDEFHKTLKELTFSSDIDEAVAEQLPWSPTLSLLDLAFKLKMTETRVFGLNCGAPMTESPSDEESNASSDLAERRLLLTNESMKGSCLSAAACSLVSREQRPDVRPLFVDVQSKQLSDFSVDGCIINERGLARSSPYQNSNCGTLQKRFLCVWCNYGTDSKSHLLRHQKSVHHTVLPSEPSSPVQAMKAQGVVEKRKNRLLRRHRCELCSYQTDSKSHLRRHQGSVHSKKKPYRCHLCKMEFSRSEKAKDHFMNVHSEEPYNPQKMRKFLPFTKDVKTPPVDTITKIKMLYEELDTGVGEGGSRDEPKVKSECADDDDENSLNVLLEKSKALKTGSSGNKPYTCLKCDYASRDIWHLKRHISDVHLMRKDYKCKICHYATNRQHRFICHMRTHGEIFCFYCDYSNAKLDVFKQHLQLCSALHKMSTDVRCRLCELDCNNPDALKEHLGTLHGAVLYSCNSCSYYSEIYEDFENHSRIHEEEDRTCKVCNIVFETKQDQNLHCSAVHITVDDSRSLTCQICQHQEVNRSAMFNHIHQHTPQLFFCDVKDCTFRSTTSRSLVLHAKYCHDKNHVDLNISLEERPTSSAPKSIARESPATKSTALGTYTCPICSERPPFRYRKSFEKHMTQHAVEAESCPLCHDTFFLHKELQEHAFTIHGVRVV